MFVPDQTHSILIWVIFSENIKNLDSKDQKSPFAKIHLLLQLPRSNSTTGDGRSPFTRRPPLLFSAIKCSAMHMCERSRCLENVEKTLTGAPVCIAAPGKYPGRLLTLKLQALLGTGLAWLLEEFSLVKLSPDQARPSHTWGGQGCPCAKDLLELCSYVDWCKSVWLCRSL